MLTEAGRQIAQAQQCAAIAQAAGIAVEQSTWDQLDQLHQQHSTDESMSGLVYMQVQAIHRVLGEGMVSAGLTAEILSGARSCRITDADVKCDGAEGAL